MFIQAQIPFILVDSPDFHRQRRKEMLVKYPEIQSLMGHNRSTKYIAIGLVVLELWLAYFTQTLNLVWWFLALYFLGATVNHGLFILMHEVSHSLAFKAKWANRCFAMVINLPLGFPAALSFEKYHTPHHRFLGDIKKDVDIPLVTEAHFFNSKIGKFLWLLIQPLTYTIRPLLKWPQKITFWEGLNIIFQILFDGLVLYFFGLKCLAFLLLSTFIAMSLHPMATHFIAEHYVVHKQQETYSYYGLMNYITFNFGYHVEHHDFPSISWALLPELKKIAPEYYESLYQHKSWLTLMWEFIFSKKLNLFSRVTRTIKINKDYYESIDRTSRF